MTRGFTAIRTHKGNFVSREGGKRTLQTPTGKSVTNVFVPDCHWKL